MCSTRARAFDQSIERMFYNLSISTSKDVLKHPITSAVKLWAGKTDALEGVVTHPALEKRLKVVRTSLFPLKILNYLKPYLLLLIFLKKKCSTK